MQLESAVGGGAEDEHNTAENDNELYIYYLFWLVNRPSVFFFFKGEKKSETRKTLKHKNMMKEELRSDTKIKEK